MAQPGVYRTFSIGPFTESAGRWLRDPQNRPDPVEPALAATVMLVRGEPLEVFMIERAATMAFAPSTWVFPGGRVDPADADLAAGVASESVAGPGTDISGDRLGCSDEQSRTLTVAVIRELFEEAGVLLASAEPHGDVVSVTDGGWSRKRAALEAHEIGFGAVVEGLHLRGDLVAPVDRWITPEFERRRYDTWFYVALLPEGSQAEAHTREAQQGRWVNPAEMLATADAGDVKLLPPTRTSLERLTRSRTACEALEASRDVTFHPTRPEAHEGDDGLYLSAYVNL